MKLTTCRCRHSVQTYDRFEQILSSSDCRHKKQITLSLYASVVLYKTSHHWCALAKQSVEIAEIPSIAPQLSKHSPCYVTLQLRLWQSGPIVFCGHWSTRGQGLISEQHSRSKGSLLGASVERVRAACPVRVKVHHLVLENDCWCHRACWKIIGDFFLVQCSSSFSKIWINKQHSFRSWDCSC